VCVRVRVCVSLDTVREGHLKEQDGSTWPVHSWGSQP